jgi:photosystem II stability/assembly factor-like uncharacterized protein
MSGAPCRPFEPTGAGFSSWPPGQPASLSDLHSSASGQYLYAVGTWLAAGATRSALVRSQDHGRTFCIIDSPRAVLSVAPAPFDERVLYLWAGETGAERMLFRTQDGGESWTEAGHGLEPLRELAPGTPTVAVGRDPMRAWTYVRTSGTGADFLQNPRFFSTRDGGTTWAAGTPPGESALPPSLRSPWFTPPAVDPTNPDVVYLLAASDEELVAFKSTDGAASWHPLDLPEVGKTMPAFLGKASIVVDGHGVVYAWFQEWEQDSPPRQPWRSDDGGRTWSGLALPPGFAPRRGLAFLASPWGLPRELVARQGASWSRTKDGGMSWVAMTEPPGPPVADTATDEMELAPEPLPGTWLLATPSGLARTTDGGVSWQATMSRPRGALLAASNSAVWLVGQNWVQRSTDGGRSWSATTPMLGSEVWAIGTPADSSVVAYVTVHSADNARGELMSTNDGGATWAALGSPPSASPFVFMKRVLAAPSQKGTVYVAANGKLAQYRVAEAAWSWLPTPDYPGFEIFPFDMDPTDSSHLVAAVSFVNPCPSSGGAWCSFLIESRDGGASWVELPGFGKRGYSIQSLAIARQRNGQQAILASGSPPTGPLALRSADGGLTFVPVAVDPGQFFVRPGAPEVVYTLGQSLSHSDDGGANWTSPVQFRVASDKLGTPSSWQSYAVGAPDADGLFVLFGSALERFQP